MLTTPSTIEAINGGSVIRINTAKIFAQDALTPSPVLTQLNLDPNNQPFIKDPQIKSKFIPMRVEPQHKTNLVTLVAIVTSTVTLPLQDIHHFSLLIILIINIESKCQLRHVVTRIMKSSTTNRKFYPYLIPQQYKN